MIDAHAHLSTLPAESGAVRGWLVPGVNAERDAASRQLVAEDARLRLAVGLHPWHLPKVVHDLPSALQSVERRLSWASVCALGECGLDRGRRAGPRGIQLTALHAQLQMATERGLPLVLHCVRSHGALQQAITASGHRSGGMVHDFQGPLETVRDWAKAGFHLSISPRGLAKEAVVSAIPDELLLVETDDEGPEELGRVIAIVVSNLCSPGGANNRKSANC